MNFNVTLDKEQIDEIASITADKVLATVKYCKNNEEWHEREVKDLKLEVSKRDSMLVQKDFVIERLRENLRNVRAELKKSEVIEKVVYCVMDSEDKVFAIYETSQIAESIAEQMKEEWKQHYYVAPWQIH